MKERAFVHSPDETEFNTLSDDVFSIVLTPYQDADYFEAIPGNNKIKSEVKHISKHTKFI